MLMKGNVLFSVGWFSIFIRVYHVGLRKSCRQICTLCQLMSTQANVIFLQMTV